MINYNGMSVFVGAVGGKVWNWPYSESVGVDSVDGVAWGEVGGYAEYTTVALQLFNWLTSNE